MLAAEIAAEIATGVPTGVPTNVSGTPDITSLLHEWSDGDKGALDALVPLVFHELHRRAEAYLRHEREGHTLQPTALINELFLRLCAQRHVTWRNREQFFGFAAQTMRRILVDSARRHRALRRGSGASLVPLDDAAGVPAPESIDLIALDDALDALERLNPQQARLVELRFFAGLNMESIAEISDVSLATVHRQWASARAWLFRALHRHATGHD